MSKAADGRVSAVKLIITFLAGWLVADTVRRVRYHFWNQAHPTHRPRNLYPLVYRDPLERRESA